VLLVEDDAAVGEGLLMLLESDGFEAELAVTGGEALSLIPTVSPDLVILDVGLPDIEGTDLYRQIASRWPEMRVIFSTGHADVAALEESLGTQVVFLQKPYAREALLDAIAAAMEQTAVA
jgi:FixJ family two-component response regulator